MRVTALLLLLANVAFLAWALYAPEPGNVEPQLIAQQLGGTVSRGGRGEYGRTTMSKTTGVRSSVLPSSLGDHSSVWMSHFDAVSVLPPGFVATASTPDAPMAVIENDARKIWGVQYHPEVVHSEGGQDLLERFIHERVGAPRSWTMRSIVEEQVSAIRSQVGGDRAICGLSGGVDSAVAAALVHKAIGSQLTCVYVDTGLMRKNESAQVVETFERNMGIELVHVDAGSRFFEADRKSTRLNSSHSQQSRMPSSA